MIHKDNLCMKHGNIMVVDDDSYLLAAIHQTLVLHGYEVDSFDKPAEALAALASGSYLAVIADIKMPLIDGLEFLQRAKGECRDLPVIMITGHGDVHMAVKAMKEGAYDFLEKPVDEDVLLVSLARAVEKMKLVMDNRGLCEQLELAREKRDRFHGLIGAHPLMRRLYCTIEIVAKEDEPILIAGETGTGKELVARAIHNLSDRCDKPFVAVNMGAIPAEMLEAELFGYEKGAFTGAGQTKIGKFEFAGEGTIFLDEICSMPVNLQSKLLRILEDRAITRLGANNSIPVQARILSATNSVLADEIETGRFRQDLYFRLNVLPITMPPLKKRVSDIPLLFDFFCREYGKVAASFDLAIIRQLSQRDWPGNVREFKNYVKRLCVYQDDIHGSAIDDSMADPMVHNDHRVVPLRQAVDEAEKNHIINALRMHGGHVIAAHKTLMISRKCLYDKINRYGIDLCSFRVAQGHELDQ